MYHVGVDTGGTFTDFVARDVRTGAVHAVKVPSVPADPARAVAEGLERLRARHGVAAEAIERFVFGTTVATNAVLERRGARTALVATRGTRDVLEIQRQWRHRLFDLALRKPEPLVPRRWRLEADERLAADGSAVTPLRPEEAERVAAAVAALGVEAVAVAFLFSFLDPRHERMVRETLHRRVPGLHVSLSAEVCPEFREYERTCTTVMNAYVMPRIHHLVERLEAQLLTAAVPAPLRIMQSNGGLMSGAQARTHPVRTLLSGPAGGVVGAVGVAAAAGVGGLLTMDMGGTSLDVSLVQGGRVRLAPEGRLGGFPVQVPQVSVHTVGAGGGSLARVVRGRLVVGPESAGADPGPVCYGRGGRLVTSTDAAIALGLIDPAYFLGGEIRLDREAAQAALRAQIGEPLGLDVPGAAWAVVRVQAATMVSGLRAVSVEQGLDPREFVLLPFGGAGSLYAGLVAEEMGIRDILAPVYPSVLSALGMLMTDVKYTRVATRLTAAERADPAEVGRLYRELEADLLEVMRAEGLAREQVLLERACDVRYRGQAYEVPVAVPRGRAGDPDLAALVAAFHEAHRRSYGAAAEDEPVELVNFRITAVGLVPRPALACRPARPTPGPPSPKDERAAYFGGGWRLCPVYDREHLAPGDILEGPALVEEAGATVVLYPGHRARVDDWGNLRVAVPAGPRAG